MQMKRSFAHLVLSSLPRPLVENAASIFRGSPLLRRSYNRMTASLKDRDSVIAAGPGRGLRFNSGASDSRFLLGTFEPALQAFLAGQLKPGMVFYDVGANVGFLSLIAAKLVGPGGEVHCFEPLPENVQRIRHNITLNGMNNVLVHPLAIGKRDGTAQFRISERPTFGALSDSPMEVDRQIGTLDVSVRCLDGLFSERQLRPPDIIKVDIEGSEVDFFAGAEMLLRRFRPVLLIELHGTNADVAAWLQKLSYNSDIVGGGEIATAPWAALALATPRDRPETQAFARTVCNKFHGR